MPTGHCTDCNGRSDWTRGVSGCISKNRQKYCVAELNVLCLKRAILQYDLEPSLKARKAIASRFGAGKKSKHIELHYLYMQELVQRGVLTLRKVGTLFNCSDVLTNYLNPELLESQ